MDFHTHIAKFSRGTHGNIIEDYDRRFFESGGYRG
jgi:hypothetical protein